MSDKENKDGFTISPGVKVGLMIAGGQINGLGLTLKSMDLNETGLDDTVGTACVAASHLLIALGSAPNDNKVLAAIDGTMGALQAVRDFYAAKTQKQ